MAFTNTKGRYASFGIVTSLPGNVIDSFWFIIDHYLKDVIPLKSVIRFNLQKHDGKIRLTFSQEQYQNAISVDLPYSFDPLYPRTVLIIDKNGKETITLPDEIGLL